MESKWEYVSLAKRFESFAARASDPKLAAVYRSLADHYRVLDQWRQTMGDRYEPSTVAQNSEASPPSRQSPDDRSGGC